MRLFTLAFLLGTLALQRAAELPQARVGLAGIAALLALRFARHAAARAVLLLAAGFLAAFGYAAWRAHERLAEALPFAAEGVDIAVTGVVAELPRITERGTRFLLHVERVDSPGATVPRVIALGWYPEVGRGTSTPPPTLVPGERWSFTVRLKRVRGLANPHGFNFEPWALERGIRATGYVRAKPGARRVDARVEGWPYTLHRWRGGIRDAMQSHLQGAAHGGVLVALALGEQEAVPPEQWDVFWRTGVGHLMSISGLHITMLAGLAFALVHLAWARVPALALRLPARKAAVVAGLVLAVAYALMTGLAVPAQRTVLMLAAVATCVLADRHGSASRVLALAVLVVLVADPWAVLSGGFWLSFGAVAAIFYALALRTGSASPWRAAVLEQLAVGVVMVPMLLALFQEVSWIAPLANAIAIPVVSLAIVPLAIAGAFLGLGGLLDLAHGLMAALWIPLHAMAAWPHAMLESHAPAGWTVVLALAGCAWLLAPRGVPLRSLGLAWMVPLFVVVPPRPAPGEAWIDVLDVGNGLAVAVRTATHALVYDAGPSWGEESDSGDRIVVPFLRGEGIGRLDALVVSHADDDHAGGAISVAALRRPGWLLSSLDRDDAIHELVARSTSCAAGQGWRWDGVGFEVLHPAGAEGKANDRSCVLRIATGGAAMLLTGDIEARSEAQILARERQVDADVLLVPHHGSRTSSSADFITAVAPRVAIIPVGHRNRFRHPHPAVLARYGRAGVAVRRTDREGALRVVLPAQPGAPARVTALVDPVPYWSDRRLP